MSRSHGSESVGANVGVGAALNDRDDVTCWMQTPDPRSFS